MANLYKETLQKLIEENEKTIEKNETKIKILNSNSFGNRISRILFITVLGYFFTYLASIALASKIALSVNYFLGLLGASFVGGTVFNFAMEKKFKTKKNISKISNAKNAEERTTEIFTYEQENEILKNRNIAMKRAIGNIDAKDKLLNQINETGEYTVVRKSEFDKNLNARNSALEDKLEEKISSLDTISKKRYLKNKKIYTGSDIAFYSMCACGLSLGSLFATSYLTPVMSKLVAVPSITSTIVMFSIPVLASIAGAIYFTQKTHNRHKQRDINKKITQIRIECSTLSFVYLSNNIRLFIGICHRHNFSSVRDNT